jgi:hypothetical protein
MQEEEQMETQEAVGRELIVLDASGDTKLVWDPSKAPEVAAARQMFTDMKKKGYLAYKVDRKGDKGEVLREFDEDAEKMIMAPQTVGG